MAFEITRSAARFMRMMVMADGGPESGFRLAVTPGGCSGLSSEITVTDTPEPGDTVVEQSGVKLFLPAESRILLDGVTIDFNDTAASTGLVFMNAKSSCGCS